MNARAAPPDPAEAERQLRAFREQHAKLQVELDEADKKADALLVAHLSDEQRARYGADRYFDVHTKKGVYRLYKGWAGNIAQLGPGGREIQRFCIHPNTNVPEADNLLAQKLMLQFDEESFLRIANKLQPREANLPDRIRARVAA